MKILTILGARPQFIKAVLKKYNWGIEEKKLYTIYKKLEV